MTYCTIDEHCPWRISGTNLGVETLDQHGIFIWDRGWWNYRDVLELLGGDLTSIPGSSGWEDFLRRVLHGFAADAEEDCGSLDFNRVHDALSGRTERQSLAEAWERSRRGATLADCDAKRCAWIRKCGEWILTAESLDEVDETHHGPTLIYAAHGQPARLTFTEVRDIVHDTSWWMVPGYSPRWERLIVQRLTQWLVKGDLQVEGACIPWAVRTRKPGRGHLPELRLERQGRSITLNLDEARHLCLRGDWNRIPGFEPQWQLALSLIMESWRWRASSPQSHQIRTKQSRPLVAVDSRPHH